MSFVFPRSGTNVYTMFSRETKLLLVAFLWAAIVVVAVHVAAFPGSVPEFRTITRGQALLDTSPSFDPAGVHDRLDAYGEQGRRNYRFRLMTVDVLLPLSLTPFLFLFMRRALGRLGVGGSKGRWLPATSSIYLVFDLAENGVLLALLSSYPTTDVGLATLLPYLTMVKRAGILGALLIPVVLLAAATIRDRLRPARSARDQLSGSPR